MVIQFSSSCKCFMTVFAIVGKESIEMNILNMFSQIASVIASLATKGTFVRPWTTVWIFHNVLIQLLVSCKQQMLKPTMFSSKYYVGCDKSVYFATRLKGHVDISVLSSDMVIQLSSRCEGFLAMLASI